MAVKVKDEVTTPKSTGAAKMPESPVDSAGVADNTSTGAVKMPDGPVETTVEHYGQPVEVRVETPTEPVTMSVSWLSDAETKVIEAPVKESPKASDAKPDTK